MRVFSRGKTYRTSRAGDLGAGVRIFIFPKPPYTASRQLLIARIAAAGTSSSPIPYHAWHGYKATTVYRVEVEVGADGPASAPPSGAAAEAPPASACVCKGVYFSMMLWWVSLRLSYVYCFHSPI
jgi:hypothetical protein